MRPLYHLGHQTTGSHDPATLFHSDSGLEEMLQLVTAPEMKQSNEKSGPAARTALHSHGRMLPLPPPLDNKIKDKIF